MQSARDDVEPQHLDGDEQQRLVEEHAHGDGEHDAEARGEEEEGGFADRRERHAALPHGFDDRREAVVGEHDVGGLARDVGARAAHRDADRGRLEGGSVVDAVARDGDRVAELLQCAHDAQLVGRRDARRDRGGAQALAQGVVVEVADLDPCDDAAVDGDAEPVSDRRSGERVVAGDHDDAQARGAALLDGCARFGPGRVGHGDESKQFELARVGQLGPVRGALGRLAARVAAAGEGEHAVPLAGELGVGLEHALARCRERLLGARDARAHGEDELGGSLDVQREAVGLVAQGLRVAVLRLVRQVGELLGQLVVGADDCRVARRDGKGHVDRVAEEARLAVGVRVAFVDERPRAQCGSSGVVELERSIHDVGEAARRPQALGGQAVLGERARLVARDDRRRPEGLDRRQGAHDRVAGGHAPHADRERDREHHGQGFGNRRDGHGDGGEEDLFELLAEEGTGDEDDRGDEADEQADAPLEAADDELQGRGIGGALHQFVDDAELGGGADRDDDAVRPAGGGEGAAEEHARAVGDLGVLGDRLGGLVHRLRLAREHGFVDEQGVRVEQPQVGRHAFAALERDDVARHELGGAHAAHVAVAHDARGGHGQRGERAHLAVGPQLLPEADRRVEHENDENRDRVDVVLQQERHRRGDDEDRDERRAELPQHDLPRRVGRPRGERVGPEPLLPLDCISRRQPARARREHVEHRGRVARVPRGGSAGGGHRLHGRRPLQKCPGANVPRPAVELHLSVRQIARPSALWFARSVRTRDTWLVVGAESSLGATCIPECRRAHDPGRMGRDRGQHENASRPVCVITTCHLDNNPCDGPRKRRIATDSIEGNQGTSLHACECDREHARALDATVESLPLRR